MLEGRQVDLGRHLAVLRGRCHVRASSGGRSSLPSEGREAALLRSRGTTLLGPPGALGALEGPLIGVAMPGLLAASAPARGGCGLLPAAPG
ncbi:hypothetical protein STRAU_5525 [Streptomyces aurantiacus JA 4570]|uniref:Uncharacterized protein n=1 Tax=Streptomyces aurantiacus JA 4570 TaxID=1286094 RepID=S4AIX7_9ACTN|nr:hypothetical protein STRAU_5525 [Streptomyces aurantiacus JA 4570]